jgi:hypothetical protein
MTTVASPKLQCSYRHSALPVDCEKQDIYEIYIAFASACGVDYEQHLPILFKQHALSSILQVNIILIE